MQAKIRGKIIGHVELIFSDWMNFSPNHGRGILCMNRMPGMVSSGSCLYIYIEGCVHLFATSMLHASQSNYTAVRYTAISVTQLSALFVTTSRAIHSCQCAKQTQAIIYTGATWFTWSVFMCFDFLCLHTCGVAILAWAMRFAIRWWCGSLTHMLHFAPDIINR